MNLQKKKTATLLILFSIFAILNIGYVFVVYFDKYPNSGARFGDTGTQIFLTIGLVYVAIQSWLKYFKKEDEVKND